MLDLEEFIERIRWDDDEELLRDVLKEAFIGEEYFEEFEIKDYREVRL